MNIAILDSGGNLKHFSRMDDSFLKSIDIALIKAETSAGLPFSTKTVGEIAATRVPGIAHIPGIATFEGGLPIMTADGKHIGSIGVSGATAEQDGICAQAAPDAVKNDLKQFRKSCRTHARRPHGRRAESFQPLRRMRSAAQAAPKPLSILVTTSPCEQLASMARSAVSPPVATP